MSYIILARKYRPMAFEEMIGQKAVVQTLQNAVKNNRVAQAYIFSGMRGVGKTTAARILAKALNCQHGPTPSPCNKCEFCREVNEDRAVDVIEIDGASNTSVDDVRNLQEGVKYKPIRSRFKVIIIDEVHMISKSAFNALLKTIEEPPPSTIFIFATTEFHKVPATIISRCQHFEFKKISQKEIINHLLEITKKENITISAFGLNLIAHAADGSLRDAQSLLDQAVAFSGENISDEDLQEILGTLSSDLLFEFSSAILQEKPERIFALVEKVVEHGYDIRYFFQELIQHFRNLLLTRTIEDPSELLPLGEEDQQKLNQESQKASVDEILRCVLALQQSEQALRFSSHPRIFLEALLIKICHFKKLVPMEKILQDVEDLRKSFKASSAQRAEQELPSSGSEGRGQQFSAASSDTLVAEREAPPPAPDVEAAGNRNLLTPEPSPKRKVKAREIDIALKDPAVQSFMKTFKAQVLTVEPIKRTKE